MAQHERSPRPAPEDVLRSACARTTDPRVRLALAFAALAGLRRGEIARIDTSDIVGATLRVRGARREQR